MAKQGAEGGPGQEQIGDLSFLIWEDEPFVTIHVRWRELPAGHAKLVKEDRRLLLGDIYIFERHLIWWKPKWMRRRLRGRGIGSALLARVIRYAHQRGFSEIYGEMAGDLSRLAAWYRRLGFEVDETTRAIRLDVQHLTEHRTRPI